MQTMGRALVTLFVVVLAVCGAICAEEQTEGKKWWEDGAPSHPTAPVTTHEPVAADLLLAEALQKHDWRAFVGQLEIAEDITAKASGGDAATLRKMGLAGLHALCEDRTLEAVFPVRVSASGFVCSVEFRGVNKDGWLRVGAGLCADRGGLRSASVTDEPGLLRESLATLLNARLSWPQAPHFSMPTALPSGPLWQ